MLAPEAGEAAAESRRSWREVHRRRIIAGVRPPRDQPDPSHDDVVWLDADGGMAATENGQRRSLEETRPTHERRPALGPRAAAVLIGGALTVGALALAGDVTTAVTDVVAPRPDATVVLDGTDPADVQHQLRARDFAVRVESVWSRVLADLPVAPTPQLPSSSRVGQVLDDGDGRRLGVRWEAVTALGEDAQWSLAVTVARRPPGRPLDPCSPAAWDQPSGPVLRCDVSHPADGVQVVRAEAVLSSSPPRAWASPAPTDVPGRGVAEQVPGYQRVVDVRDGGARVQVRLVRRLEGEVAPPLDLAALTTIATDPSWHAG